jgi:sugar phosphate isomerase/epimerase
MSPRLGLMLYTLREECARDLESTLRAVGEIGYAGVELHSLHGRDSAEVRRILDAHGLEACGRHALLEEIEGGLDALADELRTLGTDRLVVAWIPAPGSAEEADALVARIDAGAGRAQDAGLRLGFHNHDGELRPLDDRRTLLDRLIELDEDRLFFEVDLGWAWFAGVEPVGLVRRLAPRVPLVHVKDLTPAAEPRFVPVGEGGVGYSDVLPGLDGLGVEWLLVEQDEVDGSRFDAVRRSLDAVETALAGSVA